MEAYLEAASLPRWGRPLSLASSLAPMTAGPVALCPVRERAAFPPYPLDSSPGAASSPHCDNQKVPRSRHMSLEAMASCWTPLAQAAVFGEGSWGHVLVPVAFACSCGCGKFPK